MMNLKISAPRLGLSPELQDLIFNHQFDILSCTSLQLLPLYQTNPVSNFVITNLKKKMENVCEILDPLLVNDTIFFLCSQFKENPLLLSFAYIAYKIFIVICMCLIYFFAPYHLILFIKVPRENESTVKELNPLCSTAYS